MTPSCCEDLQRLRKFGDQNIDTDSAAQVTRVYLDPDVPTSASGVTRPSESPVSKGVEKFWKILALEYCAGLDFAARGADFFFASKLNRPPSDFFETAQFEGRINQIREQNFSGTCGPFTVAIWRIVRCNG